jgi:vacuolar-type H+-ATPase subunit F/Vma7
MSERVAVIGDSDLVFPLRAIGIRTFSPKTLEEAREILRSLEKEGIALCYLHESFMSPLKEERAALGKKVFPVVVGFSDYRQVTDPMGEMMKEMAIKATGSDSLVKRRGRDEAR